LIALSLISLVLFAGPPSCKARVRVSDAPTEATAATKTPATTDVANESPSLPASPVRPSSTFDIPAGLRLPTDSVHVLITDDRGSTEKRQTSEGVGSGARATGGQLNQQIDTSAPGATLGDPWCGRCGHLLYDHPRETWAAEDELRTLPTRRLGS